LLIVLPTAEKILRIDEARKVQTWVCGYPERDPRLQGLIDRLERVVLGEIKRLAVFMPPGSAKSTYGSILFPPYVMANAPKCAILAASHTTELAEKWGRRVRNLIAHHSAILGLRLEGEKRGPAGALANVSSVLRVALRRFFDNAAWEESSAVIKSFFSPRM
jgi:hypothetical protein